MARSYYFTPVQANAVLPELMPGVEEIRSRLFRARALAAELKLADTDEHRSDTLSLLTELQESVQGLLDGIVARGVEVKGVQPVLLDFPALRNGLEVYLCWREGEGRVEFWHPHHTGVKGRQRVDYDDLGVWEWEN